MTLAIAMNITQTASRISGWYHEYSQTGSLVKVLMLEKRQQRHWTEHLGPTIVIVADLV